MIRSFIVTDLLFGDCGKGTIVDALTRSTGARLIVRFNGGAQCAHNVVTPDKRHHTFHQFGSGSFVHGTKTLLSKYVLVDPLNLLVEASELCDLGLSSTLAKVYVDERALIVTPFHKALNRLREIARGDSRHGSCGMGIGETMADSLKRPGDVLRAKDLLQPQLKHKILETFEILWDEASKLEIPANDSKANLALKLFKTEFAKLVEHYSRFAQSVHIISEDQVADLLNTETTIFEAGQGTLLDEDFGFHPFTTWSKTTSHNAFAMLAEAGAAHPVTNIGVTRTYATRHGPGPLPTECEELQAQLRHEHNTFNEWQRSFRTGWLDFPLLRYALSVNHAINVLAVTHLDALLHAETWKVCKNYSGMGHRFPIPSGLVEQAELTKMLEKATPVYETIPSECVLDTMQDELRLPVAIRSFGPSFTEKVFAGLPETLVAA